MNKKVFILFLSLLFSCGLVSAQQVEKNEQHQRAEAEDAKGNIAPARFMYIRAYEDYANYGKIQQSVDCGAKAASLYYKENYYKEAFELLRRVDQTINSSAEKSESKKRSEEHTSELQSHARSRMPSSA